MNNFRNKSVCKKKLIPRHHFRRRNQPSVHEILSAATYRQRNKELLKNNKALANALQEAQCVIASNNTMLRNMTKDSNQILLARLKMKSMAKTIQTLVVDLNDVLRCLDLCCVNIPKPNISEDVRLKIYEPDLEKIDESVLSSSREDEEFVCQEKKSLIECESPENTISFGNTSATEIYNVQQYLLPTAVDEVKNGKNETTKDDAVKADSPPTPQLNLTHSSRIFESEQSQNQNQHEKVDTLKNSLSSSPAKTSVASKIPVRKNLFQESDDVDLPPVLDCINRRETFVVSKYPENERLNQVSTSGKRGTFTIAEICKEMQAQTDRRGTFVIPPLPSFNFVKSSVKMPPPSTDFGIDEKTVHLSEDMDLTEIIPSATLAAVSNSLLNKNGHSQLGNVTYPSTSKDKEVRTAGKSPPVIKMNEISPIAKPSMKTDSVKEALEVDGTKSVDSKLPEAVISLKDKTDLEFSSDDVFSCESSAPIPRASRKSVLPSFVSLSTSEKLSKQKNPLVRDVLSSDAGSNNHISSNYAKKSSILQSNETKSSSSSISSKENIHVSTLSTKITNSPIKNTEKVLDKSPEKFCTELDCTSSDEFSTDSDPDFVVDAPTVAERKRIPGRKSIKPNRRKPFIFKNSKGRKSVGKIRENTDLLHEINEKYDFSSDSEDESSKISKTVKCKNPKKSCSKLMKSKDKSTVAILERDINLKLQDQSRKKRSLNRRVSFAGLNASPSKKDEEEKLNELTEQSTNLQTEDKQKETHAIRKSILKNRKSVVVSEKQDSPCNLFLQNIPEQSTNLQAEDKQIEIRATRKSILKNRKSVVVSEKQDSPSDLFLQNIPHQEDLKKVPGKKSAATVVESNLVAISNESVNEKISTKESKVPEEEIDGKLKHICENSSDDKQNETSQSNDKFLKKTSKEGKPNKVSLKSNKCKSMLAESDINTVDIEKNDKALSVLKKRTLSISENSDRARKSSKTQADCKVTPDSTEETNSSELRTSNKMSRNRLDSFRLSNEITARNKSKRTFSGVSERSSKKRFTANDDILEDVISNFDETRPEKIHESNMKDFNKNDLNSKNSCSGNPNINNSDHKKDFIPDCNLKEDSECKINYLEKHKKDICIAKSSKQSNKEESADHPPNISDNENGIDSNLTLNSKIKSNADIKSTHSSKTSISSEPVCNIKLDEGKKSEKKNNLQSSKIKKTISYEEDLPGSSSVKENFEVKKSKQEKAKGEPSATVSKSVKIDDQSDHVVKSVTNKLEKDTEVKTDLMPNSKKKRKVNSKSKQSAEICVLSELTPNIILNEENKSPKSVRGTSPPSSKIGKTVSSGGDGQKENIVIPDLEGGGRSRRKRPQISFKEPSLNTKLRRAK